MTYTVDYQVGTYSGSIEISVDDGDDTEQIIAVAKRTLWRKSGGHPPPHYAQIFRVRT